MSRGERRNTSLHQWMQDEKRVSSRIDTSTNTTIDQQKIDTKQSLLRKTTVAYGIVQLLKHAKENNTQDDTARYTLSNFSVQTNTNCIGTDNITDWLDILDVSLIVPSKGDVILSAEISEPYFISNSVSSVDRWGRYLEVEITPSPQPSTNKSSDNSHLQLTTLKRRSSSTSSGSSSDIRECGMLLYELFSGKSPMCSDQTNGNTIQSEGGEPARKKSTVRYDKRKGKSYSTLQTKSYTPLLELGFPPSISILVSNLIDGQEEYLCLDDVIADLHLALNDPETFLFDLEGTISQIRRGKLYGREKEAQLITDSFCRVSQGKNEAFFIGGYSGAGKTMLVSSLIDRVDVSGGYVLVEKIEKMSSERPLMDILSAFNRLPLLMKNKSSPKELQSISDKLKDEFESDLSVLFRLLPNISAIFPNFEKPIVKAVTEQAMSLHNVSFTLQRFLKIASSKLHPVMLFLDDIHWAGITTLQLIERLLCDQRNSTCFMFVGSYRSNEVTDSHPLFKLLASVRLCDIGATSLNLDGLCKDDLNRMLAEMFCLFPRLCKSLSDIVFEKTRGNPFFALEFIRSLMDSRLVKYSLREKRWIWDETRARSLNITDNVLYLLSTKMATLPENIQLVLKVVSCIGIKIHQNVIDLLKKTPKYSNIDDWLVQAINEGFIRKLDNSEFIMNHDKVREAAYSLIKDGDKNQFHYDLGMSMYTSSIDQDDLSDVIFQIVGQINFGESLIQPDVDMAKLYCKAGIKAMDLSDYETSNSYLSTAINLLPENRWSSNYKLCLKIYFLIAKSMYICGNAKALEKLMVILGKGHCIEDKIDAYYLYATILHACDQRTEAYETCVSVLTQLNETIPKLDAIGPQQHAAVMRKMAKTLSQISKEDMYKMKDMDPKLQYHMKFYTLLFCIAYWKAPQIMPFIACNMIDFTIEHGVCEESVFGFLCYTSFIAHNATVGNDDIKESCRISKAAMALMKRFEDNSSDSSEMVPRNFAHWGYIATYTVNLKVCASNLKRGFEVGLSAGAGTLAHFAFYNSIMFVRASVLGGENLHFLLKEVDYHLEVMVRMRNTISLPYVSAYRETLSLLIDKGENTTNKQNGILDHEMKMKSHNPVYEQRHAETICLNKMLQSFWLGHSTRCHHFAKKALENRILGRHNRLVIHFYAALNSFRGIKNNNGSGSQFIKVKPLYQEAIKTLRDVVEFSPDNYQNKVYLLEAELHSFNKNHEQAQAKYDLAILAAKDLTYVHEEGLACELAGLHYKKSGNVAEALAYFQRAKECYTRWGSDMKVESVQQQMSRLNA